MYNTLLSISSKVNISGAPGPARIAECAGSNIGVFAYADWYRQEQELRARFETCGERRLCLDSIGGQSTQRPNGVRQTHPYPVKFDPLGAWITLRDGSTAVTF
jgi:hypothetical protein